MVAGTEGGVLKPQGSDEGCPKFNFLESDFRLATEIGGFGEMQVWRAKIGELVVSRMHRMSKPD